MVQTVLINDDEFADIDSLLPAVRVKHDAHRRTIRDEDGTKDRFATVQDLLAPPGFVQSLLARLPAC